MASTSRLGPSLRQRSNASLTASAKSSRAYKPSRFQNFDKKSGIDMFSLSSTILRWADLRLIKFRDLLNFSACNLLVPNGKSGKILV